MVTSDDSRALDGKESFDGMIVVFAGTPWDMTMLPDQHMAGRLSRFAPVLYVDPPISRLSPRTYPDLANALDGPRLRLVTPRLARLTPVVPPGVSRPGMRLVAQRLARTAARRAVRRLGGSVEAVICATVGDPFPLADERRRVYYATDDFVAGGRLMGLSTRYLRNRENRLLRLSDTVVAISPVLQDSLVSRGAVRPVLIPNGVDAAAFDLAGSPPAPSDIHLPRPIVGFVGQISERIDLRLLETVAATGRSLLLIGPHQVTFELDRMRTLLARQNVQWLGSRPFTDLPAYVHQMDVGLLPYTDSEFNRGSFPLKVLEYLAAGKAAVSSDLPAVRWLNTALIDVASDPEEFARIVEARCDETSTPGTIRARKEFAALHSWDRRAEAMARLLDLADEAGRPTRTASSGNRPVDPAA
jgi:teichuronic acid biosynthesis glycosyltransferase TuaH